MKKPILVLYIELLIVNGLLVGCATNTAEKAKIAETSKQEKIIGTKKAPEILVSEFRIPEWVKEIVNEHRADFLSKNKASAENITYRFYYDNSGDAWLEYKITPKGGYTWGTPTPWIIRRSSRELAVNYSGDRFYWPTTKQRDLNKFAWEDRMKDPVFRSIESVIYQLGLDYDYDWNSFDGNNYGRVSYENSSTVKAVCDGYADEATRRLLKNEYVVSVEKWAYPGHHAWNIINLKDGRKLYCDATWYEGNRVKNGVVPYGCEQEPEQLTFDENEFNSHGYSTTQNGEYLKIHNRWPNVRLERSVSSLQVDS